jgi:hypothetical protein
VACRRRGTPAARRTCAGSSSGGGGRARTRNACARPVPRSATCCSAHATAPPPAPRTSGEITRTARYHIADAWSPLERRVESAAGRGSVRLGLIIDWPVRAGVVAHIDITNEQRRQRRQRTYDDMVNSPAALPARYDMTGHRIAQQLCPHATTYDARGHVRASYSYLASWRRQRASSPALRTSQPRALGIIHEQRTQGRAVAVSHCNTTREGRVYTPPALIPSQSRVTASSSAKHQHQQHAAGRRGSTQTNNYYGAIERAPGARRPRARLKRSTLLI